MSDDVPAVCGCAALHKLQGEFALFGPFSIGLRTNQEGEGGGGVVGFRLGIRGLLLVLLVLLVQTGHSLEF